MNDWKQDTGALDLEEILKEFGDGETAAAEVSEIPEPAAEAAAQSPAEAPQIEETEEAEVPAEKNTVTSDTLRLDDLAQITEAAAVGEKDVTSETIRLDAAAVTAAAGEEPAEEASPAEEAAEEAADETEPEPISVTPPAPIVFNPKEKLRELKRKLVAGPARRYYERSEVGGGRLQMAMFLCLIVNVVCGGAALMYALDMVPENRQRLMVFGQVLAMLLGALLGSSQLVDGVTTLLKGMICAYTLRAVTFLAGCADSVFCLQELRVPICAAFTLEVFMALWATYHDRTTEMGMMDTMRKAIRLTSVVRCEDYFEGQSAMVRGEGQVEDFMDNYDRISGPQRVQNIYALVALLLSIVIEVGTVLCGWKGVTGLAAKCLYPLNDHDMFPVGSVKMNGVKFYGDRDPETVIAYAAALMHANGGGLAPIFDHLLASRNGVRFTAQNLHFYGNGGIGGEINGDPVLMGSLEFLKEMGVEIPDGTMVKQAVYVSVDGDLSGLFAITYNRVRHAAAGMATLCSSRRIRPVILAKDFLLTPAFLKDTFGLRPKRTAFPTRAECIALENKKAPEGAEALALTTKDGLASVAYAITGARALFTACRLGLVVHMIGGLLGLVIMAALAVLGSTQLLTPLHILLYQLVWIIPGFIVTMWTRAI